VTGAAQLRLERATLSIPAGGEVAALRSAGYALCSELVGSPFDLAEGNSLAAAAAELVEVAATLPYAVELPDLTLAAVEQQLNDTALCRRQYSGLFEVGDRGPPIAIRESVALEDEAHAWASDHLAVELEFMHWLCFQEARITDPVRRSSYQHAQRDFLSGHVLNWLPALAHQVARLAPGGPYKQIFAAAAAFAASDLSFRQAGLSSDRGKE
jgi:TorA maturation chaperone TorD